MTTTMPVNGINPVVSRDDDRELATVVQLATYAVMSVFRPRHPHQFRRGFERDRWYFAPVSDSQSRPRSNPYPSLDAAIDAVNVPSD